MVRWLRWHCPLDTGFEIRTLAVWGRARYLSVTEAPHNTNFHTWMGRNIYVSFKPPRPGTEPRTLAWKAAVLTTTLGPPPSSVRKAGRQTSSVRQVGRQASKHCQGWHSYKSVSNEINPDFKVWIMNHLWLARGQYHSYLWTDHIKEARIPICFLNKL